MALTPIVGRCQGPPLASKFQEGMAPAHSGARLARVQQKQPDSRHSMGHGEAAKARVPQVTHRATDPKAVRPECPPVSQLLGRAVLCHLNFKRTPRLSSWLARLISTCVNFRAFLLLWISNFIPLWWEKTLCDFNPFKSTEPCFVA